MNTLKIYRLAKNKFIHDLSGEGARLYGGRWNRKGDALLYFSENLSLCVLELLTRMSYEFITNDYSFLEAEVPSDLITSFSNPESIINNWRANPPISFTQDYGSEWLSANSDLGMSVPSAVLPSELNILINPNHTLFSKFKILKSGPLDLDKRILN